MTGVGTPMKKVLVAIHPELISRMKRICVLDHRASMSEAIRQACREFVEREEARFAVAVPSRDYLAGHTPANIQEEE